MLNVIGNFNEGPYYKISEFIVKGLNYLQIIILIALVALFLNDMYHEINDKKKKKIFLWRYSILALIILFLNLLFGYVYVEFFCNVPFEYYCPRVAY